MEDQYHVMEFFCISYRLKMFEKGEECMGEAGYRALFTELYGYDKEGVYMSVNGRQASPMQIIHAMCVREKSTYMREYDLDEQGNITTLRFTRLDEKEQQKEMKNTP